MSGAGSSGRCAEEGAGLGEVGGQPAGAVLAPFGDVAQRAPRCGQRQAEGFGRTGCVDHLHRVHMVMQVQAHAGQVVHQGDAVALQLCAGAHAAGHQHLRRLQCARAQQHLAAAVGAQVQAAAAAVLQQVHTDCAPAVEADAGDLGASDDLQVRPAQRRREVGLGGAAAFTVAVGGLVPAHAVLAGAVEVGIRRQAGLHAGVDEALRQRVRGAQVLHAQRAVGTMQRIGAAQVALGLAEPGQHLVERPAGVAVSGPGVVVLPLTADVDHRVDRARPAQHLATWLVATAAVQAGLRHGLEAPIGILGCLGHQSQARRAMDQHAAVDSTRLEQRHAHLRVFAQPRCQHTTGRAAADHQIVVHALCLQMGLPWLAAADSS